MKRISLVLLVLCLSIVGYLLFAPMGTGSESRMLKYKVGLESKTNDELEKEVVGFAVLKFSDGELRSICDDSHSSPWGGNMVIADGNQVIWSRMGHVCGSMDLYTKHKRYLNECLNNSKPDSKRGFIAWMNSAK